MIDLLILSFLAYLIWRAISQGFDGIQQLFQRKNQESINSSQTIKDSYVVKIDNAPKDTTNKMQKMKVKLPEDKLKDVIKEQQLIGEKQQNIQNKSKQINEQDRPNFQETVKLESPIQQVKTEDNQKELLSSQSRSTKAINITRINQIQKKLPIIEQEELFLQKRQIAQKHQQAEIKTSIQPTCINQFKQIESPPLKSLDSRVEEYEGQIKQLKNQIEDYKVEKKKYIQRIEQIMQQINQTEKISINQKEQNICQNNKIIDINQLKIELNHTHQIEREKEQKIAFQQQQNLKNEFNQIKVDYQKKIEVLNERLIAKQTQNQLLKLNKNTEDASLSDSLNQKIEFKESRNNQNLISNGNYVQQISSLNHQLILIKQNYQSKLKNVQSQSEGIKDSLQKYIAEVEKLREDLTKAENDKIQVQIQLNSKINSLMKQKEDIQKQQSNQNQINFLEERRREEELNIKKSENLQKYHTQIEQLKIKFETEQQDKVNVQKKLEQVQEELKFCQTQIQHAQTIQNQLRAEIESLKAITTTKSQKNYLTTSEVQSHPQFLKIKRKLEEYQAKIPESAITENRVNSSEIKINHARVIKERDPSPSFPTISKQFQIPTQVKSFSRVQSASTNPRVTSTIFTGIFDRKEGQQRYKTPFEKPVIQSTIYNGAIMGETFFGQTSILNEQKRNFVVNEINRLKKISAKKTKLLYRSLSKNNKPITDYTSNVPNLFIVVQLSNKRIVGAFTQTAFTKELGIGTPQKSKYMSQNKSMIMDITGEKIFINQGGHDTIRHDFKALVWGKNEFVVNCEQPLLLNCELNCEGAVYPCQETFEQFLGVNDKSIPINQFEVFRIFLG